MVCVPFSGEKQEYVARLYRLVLHMVGGQSPLSLNEIQHLVFVERASLCHVEIISSGVSPRGIGVAGLQFVVAYGAHGEPP